MQLACYVSFIFIVSTYALPKYANHNDYKKFVIIGPPGSGKGSLSALIQRKYGAVHVSAGDVLRQAASDHVIQSNEVISTLSKGGLVSDDIVESLVLKRLEESDCKSNGWILDGFPRSMRQALTLCSMQDKPNCVFILKATKQSLLDRIRGRMIDPQTNQIYHKKYRPPPDELVAARLIKRNDDNIEDFEKRYSEYAKHIHEIEKTIQKSIRIIELDGDQPSNDLIKDISNKLRDS